MVMNTAHLAYRQSKKTSMTRIDMLIALYDTTLQTIQRGIAAIETGDSTRFELERVHACRCLIALLDGINPDHGEVARNTQQLCMYCVKLVWSGNLDQWKAAHRILQPLHESFTGIRDQAVSMELNGEIPALDFSTEFSHSVG